MDNPRFNQLLDLAKDGDEASVAQLWHEFGFDFYAEASPSVVKKSSSGESAC